MRQRHRQLGPALLLPLLLGSGCSGVLHNAKPDRPLDGTVDEWQAAAVTLREQLPASVPLGQEVTCALTLNNSGTMPAHLLTVRTPLMEGMTYVRSNPPAIVDGEQLIWTLDQLGGKSKRTLEVVYQPARLGTLISRATVVTSEGLRDEKSFQTQVLPRPQPRLHVELTGPVSGLLVRNGGDLQGQPLSYQILVSNVGTDPANDVRLRVELDPRLEHESGANPLDWALGQLTPGTQRAVALNVRPKPKSLTSPKGEPLVSRITALASGQTLDQAELAVQVQEAGIQLQLSGPETLRYVGRPFTWSLEVKNTGATTLSQVVVSDILPPELEFTSASEGGKLQGREVVWTVKQLTPNEPRKLQLTTTGRVMSPRTVNRAQVTAVTVAEPPARRTGTLASSGGVPAAAQSLRAQAEAAIELRGLSAFKLKIDGRGPIQVGDTTRYTVEVVNQGSLPGSAVQVVGILPTQMRLLGAGPGQYRSDKDRIIFTPVPVLPPGQGVRYVLDVQAVKDGDARFRAELTSATMHQPVAKENSISILSDQADKSPPTTGSR